VELELEHELKTRKKLKKDFETVCEQSVQLKNEIVGKEKDFAEMKNKVHM